MFILQGLKSGTNKSFHKKLTIKKLKLANFRKTQLKSCLKITTHAPKINYISGKNYVKT